MSAVPRPPRRSGSRNCASRESRDDCNATASDRRFGDHPVMRTRSRSAVVTPCKSESKDVTVSNDRSRADCDGPGSARRSPSRSSASRRRRRGNPRESAIALDRPFPSRSTRLRWGDRGGAALERSNEEPRHAASPTSVSEPQPTIATVQRSARKNGPATRPQRSTIQRI